MKIRGWLVLTILALITALAGCSRADPSLIAAAPAGAGGDTNAAAGPAAIDVAADPAALAYQQQTLSGPADQAITVNFTNPAGLQHNWVLAKPGQEQALADAAAAKNGDARGDPNAIAAGAPITSQSEAIQLPPTSAGTYTYLCTVPGHYASGMKGTLTLGSATAEAGGASSAASAASPAGSTAPAGGAAAAPNTVSADPSGAIKYQQTTLSIPADQAVTITFNNSAPLPHNWVLVQPGQEQTVADAAAVKNGDPTGISGVIAPMPIINGGSNGTASVPATAAGQYPYICTYPGHYALGMKGVLNVGP